MKITIRTNPEIVIDVDSIAEEKKVEQTIVVPEPKVVASVKPEPVTKIEKRVRALGIARNARQPDIVLTIALTELEARWQKT